MSETIPRTSVEDCELPRMIMGTNWVMGWSHTGHAADLQIKQRYATPESMYPIFEAFLSCGVDAVMGPVSQNQILIDAIRYAEDRIGKGITVIDTPIIDVEDTEAARREARRVIAGSAAAGSRICMIHHTSIEKLVNRQEGTIERIDDYTSMIRDAGMIPGATAHMPEVVIYGDRNDYDLQTYVQIFNCMGFLMQVEIEAIASTIQNAKKPIMVIKSMAAGRCSPFVGLTFAWNCIRKQDMVVVGCFDKNEVFEDAEISMAAIEGRFPNLEKRSSPNPHQDVLK